MRISTPPTFRPTLILAVSCALVGLVATPAAGRDLPISVGMSIGYFAPTGEWTAHPYAAGVDQFQGGVAVSFDFELPVSSRASFAAFADYTSVGVDDWEEYCLKQGDQVYASAGMTEIGVLFRYYVVANSPNHVDLDLGLAYCMLGGDETYNEHVYDYDFLFSKVGLVFGVGYRRSLNRNLALTLSARGVYIPRGVQYASGMDRDVIGLRPVSLGIRYMF